MPEEQLTNVGPGATERRDVSATAEIFRSKGLGKSLGFEPEAEAPEVAPASEPEPATNAVTEGEATPDPEPAEPPAAEPVEPEAKPEPKKFKVRANGQDLEVTEDELIRGYRRDVDWQTSRREIEADKAKIAQERQHYAQQLQHLVPALQQQILGEFADIKTMADVQTMARENPARFTEWQAKQLTLQTAQAEQDRVNREREKEQQDAWAKRVAEESEKLGEKLPEFRDAAKREPFMAKLKSYLKAEIGYSDAEISRAADHRDIIVAHKAMLWDEAQKAKAKVKTVDVPTPVKPGRAAAQNGKGEDLNNARGALKKSGSISAFAEVLKRRGIN